MKLRVIFEELYRSISRNIVVNIMLMIQFSICMFLLTTMITFYVDVGNSKDRYLIEYLDDREWYEACIEFDVSGDTDVMYETIIQPDIWERINGYYEDFSNNPQYEYISCNNTQAVYIDKMHFDKVFEWGKYDEFLDISETVSNEDCIYQNKQEGIEEVCVKSVQMNINAYDVFGLEIENGEGFTIQNTTIDDENDYIPIILGSDYSDIFEIGESFDISLPTQFSEIEDWKRKAVVIGFLKEGELLPITEGGTSEMAVLDNYVIYPNGMKFNYIPSDHLTRQYYIGTQFFDCIFNSKISLNEQVSYGDVILDVNELSEKYDMFDISFSSTSFGMDMLRNESKSTLQVMKVLSVALLVFTIFCLVTGCITRLNKNLKTYAIYISNGCALSNIIATYVFENIMIVLPAIGINYYIMKSNIESSLNYGPLWIVITGAITIFVIMTCITLVKLSRVNIEEYMRSKE